MPKTAPAEQAVLVERAKHDPDAFLELYDRHVSELYRYAYYRLGDRAAAEDAVSETFLQVTRYLDRYEERGVPFRYWLYRIAGSVVSRNLRYRRRERPAAAEGWEQVAGGTEPGAAAEERLDLQALLRTLPEAQQQALALRYVQDLSLRETARVMERSEGAVKQLVFRGLQTLRERMGTDE